MAELVGWQGLVTGASSGLGWETALALSRAGVRLAVTAREIDLLEKLADTIAAEGGARPVCIVADLSVPGAAATLAREASQALGSVDLLVNNAGASGAVRQSEGGDRPETRLIFEVNFWSPQVLTAALVPGMLERKRGAVVNVTSVGQATPFPGYGHYNASKAALAAATETLRVEVQGSGVQVVQVVLGPLDTVKLAYMAKMTGAASAGGPPKPGKPSVAAEKIVRALKKGEPRIIYPRMVTVPYLFPSLGRRVAASYAKKAVLGDGIVTEDAVRGR